MQKKSAEENFIVFCDGACSGNPGPGGWGSIIVYPQGQVEEIGGRANPTTNNQMELMAAIAALEAIKGRSGSVNMYTDSSYVIRGITQWVWGWMKNGWSTADKKEVANQDLWQELARLAGDRKKNGGLAWHYVRGHAGIPGNERVDRIAVSFSQNESPVLYEGPLEAYSVDVKNLPRDTNLPANSYNSSKKNAAYSYLSLVNGILSRHANWAECERRVKGQPNAKFKKALTGADEEQIIRSWGLDPQTMKKD